MNKYGGTGYRNCIQGAGISGTEDLLSGNDAVLMHTVTETT